MSVADLTRVLERLLVGALALFVVFVLAPLLALAFGVSGDIAPMFGLLVPGSAMIGAVAYMVGCGIFEAIRA